jgi:putative peptide zinc metalloprotease protein
MAVAVYPPLRADVRLSRRDTPEGPRIVLKDPVTQRFFELREAESAIVERLDGILTPEQIASRIRNELELDLAPDAIGAFAAELQRLGLLAGATPVKPQRKVYEGNFLYLRLKAFDPDRLLDRLVQPLGGLFTARGVAFEAVLIVIAGIVTLLEHDAILAAVAEQWRLDNLLFAWATILVVTAGHEFAHGLTCKRFGGEVHEMGFLLIYFQPALYCNISDAWLFPKRSERLWVTFAGAWFELVVWAVATTLWRVVEPNTWIARAALVVMATTGIKLFFNLNPLIKLDGYYLLSDLLETPNLRARAVAALKGVLRRACGIARVEPAPTRRESLMLATYGVLAIGFTWWLLGGIAWHATSFLTDRYQGSGAVLAAGLISGMVWPSLKGMFARIPVLRVSAPSLPSPPSLTPRARVALLAVLTLALTLVWRVDLTVGGAVTLHTRENADLRAGVEGIIDRVYVDEGDHVAAGDTIARISDREYRTRLHEVEARIKEQDAKLGILRAGARAEELGLAGVAVARAEESVRFATLERDRLRALRSRDAASPAEMDAAEERVALATRELEDARGRLSVLRAGARPEELAASRQARAALEAERDRLREQLRSLALVTPHAGVVITPRLRERVGSFAAAGDLVAEIHEMRDLRAELEVPERDLGVVRIGQAARLRMRAWPERTFVGEVIAIAPAVTVPPAGAAPRGERTVRVEIAVRDTSRLLAPGLGGYARISTGDRRLLDVMTRRLRRFARIEFWSWW